jgi:hypothetical protein
MTLPWNVSGGSSAAAGLTTSGATQGRLETGETMKTSSAARAIEIGSAVLAVSCQAAWVSRDGGRGAAADGP